MEKKQIYKNMQRKRYSFSKYGEGIRYAGISNYDVSQPTYYISHYPRFGAVNYDYYTYDTFSELLSAMEAIAPIDNWQVN
jgi:hypothetical protein